MYQLDSRKIQSGDVFICLPGGEKYVSEALSQGASEVIYKTRPELAEFACSYFSNPSQKMCVIGVTGTNGKTTVTQWVSQALVAAGFKPFVLGTLNSPLTTPESLDIQRMMAEHLANGGTHFVMEVSSHAIHQGRISGIQFAVKLLTNITQDHLDYHGSFEDYSEVKHSFMRSGPASIYPEEYQRVIIPFRMPVPGQFNVCNMQATLAILKKLGLTSGPCLEILAHIKAPAGRFEPILCGQSFHVIVDYAHTPDGLHNVLREARSLADQANGKLLTLFGCGGDRDRTKRPKMASIAETFSDIVVVTQDNPRTEDSDQIFQDIVAGFEKVAYQVIPDRHVAIEYVVGQARPHDVVMIAGKGHETYQLIKGQSFHFDDGEEVRKVLSKHGLAT